MDHCYNIVWADDEIAILIENNRARFEKKGLNVIPFTNADTAIEYILKHPQFVDGIIVDGKFSTDGSPVDESSSRMPGLSRFMQKLSAMRAETKMPLPCWIFTGFGEQLRDKYDENDLEPFEDVISKSANYLEIGEWLDAMCEKIKETQNEDFRIRQENADLFAMCTDKYLGEDKATYLMDIIKFDRTHEGVTPFHPIRMLLESTLCLLQNRGIIQGTFSPTANGEKARWLRDNNWVDQTSMRMPSFVIDSITMLAHNSSMSHPENKEVPNNYDSHEFYHNRAPYMFSLMYDALRSVLSWIKHYLDDKPAPFVSQYAIYQQSQAPQERSETRPEEKTIPEGFLKATLTECKTTTTYRFLMDDGSYAIYYPKKVNPDTQVGDTFVIKMGDKKTAKGDGIVLKIKPWK